MSRALPTISTPEQLVSFFANWKNTLRQSVRSASAPPPPFNFKAVAGTETITLSWAKVQYGTKIAQGQDNIGPDGYELLRSFSGDFQSDLVVIPIRDINQTNYVDTVGATTKASYRIHTTAGTESKPHSVLGTDTGVVTATTGSGATTRDIFTTDQTRSLARKGRYKVTL